MGNERAVTRQPLPAGRRFRVLRRDGFRCVYCGASAREARLVVDHVIPVARGGRDTMETLATACDPCNLGKGTLRRRVSAGSAAGWWGSSSTPGGRAGRAARWSGRGGSSPSLTPIATSASCTPGLMATDRGGDPHRSRPHRSELRALSDEPRDAGGLPSPHQPPRCVRTAATCRRAPSSTCEGRNSPPPKGASL